MSNLTGEVTRTRTYRAQQSWYLERLVKFSGDLYRVHIRRNAYPEQSHGKLERWDGSTWQLVEYIPGPSLQACDEHLCSYTNTQLTTMDMDALNQDTERLLDILNHMPNPFPDAPKFESVE